MRIFSKNRLVAQEKDSYVRAQEMGKCGRFQISMTHKQASMMDSRRFTLELMERANWVEDGFHIVMGQMLFSDDSLLPYLSLSYPKEFMGVNERHTETADERKTLLYRLRLMLRALKTVKDRYEMFEQWRFSGLEFAMQSFGSMVKQAFGQVAYETDDGFYRRMRSLWKAVTPELDSPDDVGRELEALINQADIVFETLRRYCRIREDEIAQQNRTRSNLEIAADALCASASDMRETNRLGRKALKIVEHLAGSAAPRISKEDDLTSREAGLFKLNPSRQREIKAASELSHKEFPVSRNAKAGEHSLFQLAKLTWTRHREDFESLASLESAPGYANPQAFACALYRFAKNYPEAAHFRWIPFSGVRS